MVTIRLNFESIADRDKMLEHFADSVETVVSEEPGVSSYRAAIDITDPNRAVLIERRVVWQSVQWVECKTKTPSHTFGLGVRMVGTRSHSHEPERLPQRPSGTSCR